MPRTQSRTPDNRQDYKLEHVKLNIERMKLVKLLHTSSGNFAISPATRNLIAATEQLLDKIRNNISKM